MVDIGDVMIPQSHGQEYRQHLAIGGGEQTIGHVLFLLQPMRQLSTVVTATISTMDTA
jgi:hypothetical protein